MTLPLPFSWVELHGALTHFPIVFLLAALACDMGALLLRRPEIFRASLALLAAAVVSSMPALLTGYLSGRGMSHPPVGFQSHWVAAVATASLASLLLLGRLAVRDHLSGIVRAGAIGLALAASGAVSYTGYMGGQMVFGGTPPPAAPVRMAAGTAEKPAEMELAAGNLNLAAERLDLAADKLAFVTQAHQSPPQPRVVQIKVAPTAGHPVEAQLKAVNDRLAQVTVKLDAIAQRLPELAVVPTPVPASKGGKADKAAPVPEATATATPKPDANAGLAAKGEVLFRSDDLGCISCHKIAGEGGAIGPDLTREGQRGRDDRWQTAHLKDPAGLVPGSRMPSYDTLPLADEKALVAYLKSLK